METFFKPGENVVFVDANCVARRGVVVREYVEENSINRRVEIECTESNGKKHSCRPSMNRVGRITPEFDAKS